MSFSNFVVTAARNIAGGIDRTFFGNGGSVTRTEDIYHAAKKTISSHETKGTGNDKKMYIVSQVIMKGINVKKSGYFGSQKPKKEIFNKVITRLYKNNKITKDQYNKLKEKFTEINTSEIINAIPKPSSNRQASLSIQQKDGSPEPVLDAIGKDYDGFNKLPNLSNVQIDKITKHSSIPKEIETSLVIEDYEQESNYNSDADSEIEVEFNIESHLNNKVIDHSNQTKKPSYRVTKPFKLRLK